MDNLTATEWAAREFRGSLLGHGARKKRLIEIAARLKLNPSVSLPKASPDWATTRATYRFASNPEVSHSGVMAGPVAATVERIRGKSRVLVIQDTTHISLGGDRASASLGPVGPFEASRGFLAHTALVVADGREPVGVIAQEVWARTGGRKSKGRSGRHGSHQQRESTKWAKTAIDVEHAMATLDADRPSVVEVFDAEGDFFDLFMQLIELGHGFVIRAARERRLEADDSESEHLSEAAMTATIRGQAELFIPSRPGRAARTAVLNVRSADVVVQPPPHRRGSSDPIDLRIVCLDEAKAPDGVEPISWVLYTTESVDTFGDCVSVVSDYAARWLIEEFHMALKTGCAMEDRQLQTFDALTILLAIVNPIAVSLLGLRHLARSCPDRPADGWLTPMQMRALRTLRPKLSSKPTIRETIRTIASIGGFLGRKGDGEPGWRTIWSGFRDVLLIAQAFESHEKSG